MIKTSKLPGSQDVLKKTNAKAVVKKTIKGISKKTVERLKKEFKEAKKFKQGEYVEITGGVMGKAGQKGLVLGHTIAIDKKKPHVFVIVRPSGKNEGLAKYPKNLKKATPKYIG